MPVIARERANPRIGTLFSFSDHHFADVQIEERALHYTDSVVWAAVTLLLLVKTV